MSYATNNQKYSFGYPALWIKETCDRLTIEGKQDTLAKLCEIALTMIDYPDATFAARFVALAALSTDESDPALALKFAQKSTEVCDEIENALKDSKSPSHLATVRWANEVSKLFVQQNEHILEVQRNSDKVLTKEEKNKLRTPFPL